MYEKEPSVFEALKVLFAQHPEGCYPFDQKTYEDLLHWGEEERAI